MAESKTIESKNKVAISRSKIGDEMPMVVGEIIPGCLYTGFFGILDSSRIQLIIERIMDMLVEKEAECIILDISNVEVIDTVVAARFLKLAQSIRAVGSIPIFCGIPPVIAQSMVETGIMLESLITKRNLKSALKEALGRLGLKIVDEKVGGNSKDN